MRLADVKSPIADGQLEARYGHAVCSECDLIRAPSKNPPADSVRCDLQAISTKSHAAPAASSLFAGVVEMQHALRTFADALTTGLGEQYCRAVRQRGKQILWLLRIEAQFL